MRQNAMQRRDERIIDLWRKDTEMATVQELVTAMKEHRNSERIDFPALDYIKNEEQMNETQPSIGFPSVSVDPLYQTSQQMHSLMSSTVQAHESNQKGKMQGKGSDPDGLAGASTQYPQESIQRHFKSGGSSKRVMPSPKARMLENLSKKKYITDKDAEIERVRQRDEKLKD